MMIETLWIMRIGETAPELLEAWDEVSVEENREGFNRSCKNSLASVGEEIEAVRYITLKVGHDIYKAFETIETEAAVVDYREGPR